MARRIEKRQPATYQDVIDAPETLVAELIDDTLYLSPRPTPPHAEAASALLSRIRGPGGPGSPGAGWRILIEPELHLPDGLKAIVPDLAGWRTERSPSTHELKTKAYIDVVPDWICEIRSEGTARLDRQVKMPRYLTVGVKHVWIVHLIDQTLEVYIAGPNGWILAGNYGEDDNVNAVPFTDLTIALGTLWLPDE